MNDDDLEKRMREKLFASPPVTTKPVVVEKLHRRSAHPSGAPTTSYEFRWLLHTEDRERHWQITSVAKGKRTVYAEGSAPTELTSMLQRLREKGCKVEEARAGNFDGAE